MVVEKHIRFSKDIVKQVESISSKTGNSFAKTVRDLVEKGLGQTWNDENADYIAKLVRDSVDVSMKPYVERLAALESKTLNMAATSTFLLVQTLQDLVPVEKRKDVVVLYEKARKMAVEYARTKTGEWKGKII